MKTNRRVVSLEQVLGGDEEDMMLYLAQTNDAGYNMRKLVEESIETAEAMIKYINKHPDHPSRPKKSEIMGEFGDAMFRGFIAMLSMYPEMDFQDIGDMIEDHVRRKVERFKEHIQNDKYKGFV